MRLLLATDQPFWQCRGGAQQRMACLWAGLRTLLDAESRATAAVFYLGDPAELPPKDSWRHASLGQLYAPRQSSHSWFSWRGLGAVARARRSDRAGLAAGHNPQGQRTSTLQLTDYQWPWVARPFRRALLQFQPDVVILEYVTMQYLMSLVTPQQQRPIVWAIDTHDCLSQRQQLFQAAGQPHWLAIGEQEEVEALDQADLVIAIQPQEARWFAERLTRAEVVVAQHAPAINRTPPQAGLSSPQRTDPSSLNSELVVGFLASNNYPNQDGIHAWLSQVAVHLRDLPVRLIIAGSIGDYLREQLSNGTLDRAELPTLELIGAIDDLAAFYQRCDVILNPVSLGTGLKIKTVEALAFHRPVLASAHAAGDWARDLAGVVICRDSPAWVQQLQGLVTHPESLSRLQQQAADYAQRSLSPAAVYGDLANHLQKLRLRKRGEQTIS